MFTHSILTCANLEIYSNLKIPFKHKLNQCLASRNTEVSLTGRRKMTVDSSLKMQKDMKKSVKYKYVDELEYVGI